MIIDSGASPVRVRLRAIERSDIPKFVRWLNDPEVIAGLLLYAPMSQADEEGWFERMLSRPVDEHALGIEILDGEEWQHVGNCGYHNFDWRAHAVEVGIVIGEKSVWNKGYGTDVMRLMLKYGFETLNMNRIALVVYASNPRAIRSYEKAGFVHEGRRRQATYKAGKYVDEVLMSVLREEWEAAQAA